MTLSPRLGPGLLVLLVLLVTACGGQAAVVDDRGGAGDGGAPKGARDASTADASADAARKAGPAGTTCAAWGCTTAFRCAACDPDLICDDLHGPAACVTIEQLSGCGPGTMFCNSSCGVCLLSGARCVIDSCGPDTTKCAGNASCGTGTACDGGRCVPK